MNRKTSRQLTILAMGFCRQNLAKNLIQPLVLLFLGFGGMVLAQNDMIANVNMQFQFTNPGARSLAMGGAFVGLADDHTVLFANPAGLTRVRQRTISMEFAQFQNDHNIPFYGGNIVQTGIQDLDFQLQEESFPDDRFSVPFLSVIVPGETWNWGVFYARQADSKRQFDTKYVKIPDAPFEIRPVIRHQDYYFFPSDNQLELFMESVGSSLGWKVNDALSFGGTVALSRLNYEASTFLNIPAFEESQLQVLEPLFGENVAQIYAEGTETGLSGFLGMLYQPNDRFRLGLTYQRYPKFDYDYRVLQRDILLGDLSFTDYEEADSGTSAFHVPDNASLGVSMRSSDAFLVSIELRRVFYSELVDDYYQFFEQNGNDQTVDDATEYHFGLEYFFLNSSVPVSLRAGYWFEPYHALTNNLADTQIIFRDDAGDLGVRNSVFLQRFEHDLDHLTLGFGVTLGQRFLLDFGIDWTDESQVVSATGTYRF